MRPVDALISRSRSWDEFWRALTTARAADPGKAFERLTQLYLLSHPEYRSQLAHVWRVPEEVPPAIRSRLRLPSTDEGIDLLAQTHDKKFWAIQCKFRSDATKRLTYGELSTFISLAFVTCKGISLGVVAHTCSKPVRKHQYLGEATEIGLDRWLALTDDDWAAIRARISGKSVPPIPRVPRSHQRAAIDAAAKHFATESRGRMIMPCGTGKSLTAFWIAQALDAKSILVAVPNLALIRQSLLDWTREYLAHGETPQWLVVCSDESTGNLERDEFVGETYDLGIPATTNAQEIASFLRRRTGRRIVFTTYQSGAVLAAAARAARVTFDVAILDEAHKTVGVKSKDFAVLLSERRIAIAKRLYMTATERVLRGESDEVFSMDDESVYGKRFYQLTFKDAIDQQIISDYRILTITISDQKIHDLVSENRLIDLEGRESDAQSLAAAIALRRVFAKQRISHAVSFHRTIKAAAGFCDMQAGINKALRPRVAALHVSSQKSAGERADLMRDFVRRPRALMTNARCLNEGVDVPAIDCVLFADPKRSVVDIVQAAGRALRPHPRKTFGYILLPLLVPAGTDINTFAETTAFKRVAKTVTALSTQDERIAEQFRAIDRARSSGGRVVEIEGDVPVGMTLDIAAFGAHIEAKLWERVGKANWREFEAAREFARGLKLRSGREWQDFTNSGRLPPDIPANPHTVYLGKGWVSRGDWLGTGTIAPQMRRYRPFEEARAFVRGLGIPSETEWRKQCKGLPADIPRTPPWIYANAGWLGWGDWLGTGAIAPGKKRFWDFATARTFARQLQFSGVNDWYEYRKSGRAPAHLPSNPQLAYAKEGWAGWGDFLGTGNVAHFLRQFRSFSDAREYARSLRLTSGAQWQQLFRSGKLAPDLPCEPSQTYRKEGWKGWADFLGTVDPKRLERASFEEAREYARTLKLRTGDEWRAYAMSGLLPSHIPTEPQTHYRNKGWVDMRDWLGLDRISRSPRFCEFHAAREFARSLRLNKPREWFIHFAKRLLPADMPPLPHYFYRDSGWSGWDDWLGLPPGSGVSTTKGSDWDAS